MSYCRFNEKDSDVYVIRSIFNTFDCWVAINALGEDQQQYRYKCVKYEELDAVAYNKIIGWLLFLRELGGVRVPQRALDRLKKERETCSDKSTA